MSRQLIRDGFTVCYRSIFDYVRDFLHDEAFKGHDRILNRYLINVAINIPLSGLSNRKGTLDLWIKTIADPPRT